MPLNLQDSPKYEPKNEVKKAVIMLHGYGANGNDLLDIAKILSNKLKNTFFTSPNALYEFPMYPNSYMWYPLELPKGGDLVHFFKNPKSYNQEEVSEYLLDKNEKAAIAVINLIKEIKEKYNLKTRDIFLFGFSQGAMLALYFLYKDLELGGIIAHSGGLIQSMKDMKINDKIPVCLLHGMIDQTVPFMFSKFTEEKLLKAKIDITAKYFNNLGHSISEDSLSEALKFIERNRKSS